MVLTAVEMEEYKEGECILFGNLSLGLDGYKFNLSRIFTVEVTAAKPKVKPRRKIYKLNNIAQSNNNEIDVPDDDPVSTPKTFTREKDSPLQQHYFLSKEYSSRLQGGVSIHEIQKSKTKERLY